MPTELFPLGQCVITANARDVLHQQDVQQCLQRHAIGDWGDLCEDDQRENALALTHGMRVFSRYRDRWGQKFYIITETTREVTTVLLPEDY